MLSERTDEEKNGSDEFFGRCENTKSGSVRTVFVFTNLPRHTEFRAGDLPLLNRGDEIDFSISLKSLKDLRKVCKVEGPYRIISRKLRYVTSRIGYLGLTQYIELEPVSI